MRIAIGTDAFVAVAFTVPVAEWLRASALDRAPALASLGPDVLSADFSSDEAIARLLAETHRLEEITRTGDPLLVSAAYDGMEIRW
jgi:formamidopyrimidine-DNA glycosylase